MWELAFYLATAGDVFGGVYFLLSIFPRDVFDEIWDWIESVPEDVFSASLLKLS